MTIRWFRVPAIQLLLAVSCGGGAVQEPIGPFDPQITILPPTLELSPGETVTFQAMVRNVPGDGAFLWRTTDSLVATVDDHGRVRGIAIGRARIIVSWSVNTVLSTFADVVVSE